MAIFISNTIPEKIIPEERVYGAEDSLYYLSAKGKENGPFSISFSDPRATCGGSITFGCFSEMKKAAEFLLFFIEKIENGESD